MSGMQKSRSFLESLTYAVEGVLYCMRTQKNMRVHALLALLVLMAGVVIGVTPLELSVLVLTVALVMVAEMFNTAVEAVVDLVTDTYHPLARVAKNVAAGAVLLSAVGSLFVGLQIFFSRLATLSEHTWTQAKAVPETVTLVALGAVLVVVILVKAGAPPFRLQGGFPSAHTALAFALATLAWLLGGKGTVTLLSFGIATLVGQARLEAKIHTLYEVVAGALIGTLLTMAIVHVLWQ